MKIINQFASKTPYQVNELTESFVKLANRGLNPTMDDMMSIGDIAASQGKPFLQFTEALLDSMIGQNARMVEFGLILHKNKGKVNIEWKGITKTVKNTPEEIKKAILELGKIEGVTGSMNNVSKTFIGMSSTLKDNIDLLAVKIGTSFLPHLNKIIIELLKITDSISTWMTINDKLVSQGIDKFFETLSDAINILKVGIDTGIIPAIIGMKLAFEIAKLSVIAYETAIVAYNVIQSILNVGLIATTKLIIAQNAAWLANPIGLVIVSIAALASGFYLLYKNIEIVDGWLASLWNWFTKLNVVLKIVIGYLTLTGIAMLIAFAPVTATIAGILIALYALVKAYQYVKSKISGEPIETEIKPPEMPSITMPKLEPLNVPSINMPKLEPLNVPSINMPKLEPLNVPSINMPKMQNENIEKLNNTLNNSKIPNSIELTPSSEFYRNQENKGLKPLYNNQLQSANSGILIQTINRNNNSNVVVDFKNLPQFANVTQKGMAPNISVNTGKFANPFAPAGFNPIGY